LGEQAHIVSREKEGPRGESILTLEERDNYANLILLCPTDHSQIDRDVAGFPIEKLHQLKTAHELWVQTKLGEGGDPSVADQVYAHLLDLFVSCCDPEHWEVWASRAIYQEPLWSVELSRRLWEFEVAVLAAIWPGRAPALERSLISLATVLKEARETRELHAGLRGEDYICPKFYKQLGVWDTERYNQLFEEWREWQTKVQALAFELTRAGNWVADEARANVNPGFLALNGKLRLHGSTKSDLGYDTWIPEYLPAERDALPGALAERFRSYRSLFPFKLAEG